MKNFLCVFCNKQLELLDNSYSCSCKSFPQIIIRDGILIFTECEDKYRFFDHRVSNKLTDLYKNFTPLIFKDHISRIDLYNMDIPNKAVAITSKFWWEKIIGNIHHSKILEVGCGVNYLVPYHLLNGNSVFAFDISEDSVVFLRDIAIKSGVNTNKLKLCVADATTLNLNEEFDIIEVNNVLHHIPDRISALKNCHRHLSKSGKMIIVEPNYFYPPRWVIQTDALGKYNPLKSYYTNKGYIEKDEKALIFMSLIHELESSGFTIEYVAKDVNFIGYAILFWLKQDSKLSKLVYKLDMFLSQFLPISISPFFYIIARKS